MKSTHCKIVLVASGFLALAGCYAEPDYSHYNVRPVAEVTTYQPPGEPAGPHYRPQPRYDNSPPRAVVTGQGYQPGPHNGPGYSPE